MNILTYAWDFFDDPANWTGSGSIQVRLAQHAVYTVSAVGIAAVIAMPIGILTGHTKHGGAAVSQAANAARALPTLGVLILLVILMGAKLVPVMIPLVALAIPPILLNTDAGLRSVDPHLTDAARGLGLSPWQTVARAEIPAASRLILTGLRSAAVQTAATATIAAQVSFGGLGRFIIDGLAVRNYSEVVGGSVLTALFAVAIIAVFALAGRFLVRRGVRLAGAKARQE